MSIRPRPSLATPWALLAVCGVLALAACGGGGGESAPPPPPPPIEQAVPGLALIKLAVGEARWVGLAEQPRRLESRTRPERRLLLSREGGREQAGPYLPPAGWSLIDFALHPSGQLSLVLASDRQLRLLRLDPGGQLLHQQDFLDPLTPTDPFIGDEGLIPDPQSLLPHATRDAARLAALGEDLLLAFRSGRHAVLLHRLAYGSAGFEKRWRSLVEPGVHIDPRAIIGGVASFDPFQSLDKQWHLLLAADGQGRIALAVGLDSTELAEGHGRHFGDLPAAGLYTGLLLSQFSADGRRLGSLLLNTAQRSEPHALRWIGERVAVAGRVRSVQSPEGWNGFVALVSAAAPRLQSYQLIDVDLGEVIFDLAALPDGRMLAAGSAGYTQNPLGASVSEQASPLLAELATDGRLIRRLPLQAGPRHNQLRALMPWQGGWLLGGMENGPGTHSADADPALLKADGYLREQSVSVSHSAFVAPATHE